jgi:hypothetical protein
MSAVGAYGTLYPQKKKPAADINLVFDTSLGYKRIVCATCRVPFTASEPRIDLGTDEMGKHILICRDCQRQVPDDEDWDVLAEF